MKSVLKLSFLLLAISVTAAFATNAKKTLSVWIMPNGATPKEKLQQTLADFTKQTGYPTEVRVLDWGEAWNSISTMLRSGQNQPDVVQLGTTWIPYFASRGEIKPLNPYLKEFKADRFVPVSWNTTHIDSDTTIYSIPWFIDIRAILANKRILDKNGISAETLGTYDGFASAVRKINANKEILDDGIKVKGFAFPGKSDWNIPHNFAPWIWSNGGDFIKKGEDGKWKSNILDKQTLLGINRYLKFIIDTLVSTESLQQNTAQIAQQFNNGELAFIVNTSEIIMQTRIDGNQGGLSNARIGLDGIDVFAIPQGSVGSVSFIGGSNLAIPAKNNRPEAIKLLKFLTQDAQLDSYTKQIGFLPPSKEVLSTWSEDDIYKKLVVQLESGKSYTAIPEWGDIEQILVNMFSAIWDLLEIPALYSEDKLYNIFAEYSNRINIRLGNQDVKILSADEFKNYWQSIDKPKNATAKNNEVSTRTHITNNLRLAPWLFTIIFLFGFAFSYKNKRK